MNTPTAIEALEYIVAACKQNGDDARQTDDFRLGCRIIGMHADGARELLKAGKELPELEEKANDLDHQSS